MENCTWLILITLMYRHTGLLKLKGLVTLAGDGNIQQVEIISNKDILAVAVSAYREKNELNINTLLDRSWYKLRIVRAVYNKNI